MSSSRVVYRLSQSVPHSHLWYRLVRVVFTNVVVNNVIGLITALMETSSTMIDTYVVLLFYVFYVFESTCLATTNTCMFILSGASTMFKADVVVVVQVMLYILNLFMK
jgi:hypothetical protein